MHGVSTVQVENSQHGCCARIFRDAAQGETCQRLGPRRDHAVGCSKNLIEAFNHEYGISGLDDTLNDASTCLEFAFLQPSKQGVHTRRIAKTGLVSNQNIGAFGTAEFQSGMENLVERCFGSEGRFPVLLEIENPGYFFK